MPVTLPPGPWEVRATDDFESVFAAISKWRPDGLYVPAAGPVMRIDQTRIGGFALKSRLPSMYSLRVFVDAGGLMYYGADLADSYRRVAYYVDRILKGATCRPAVMCRILDGSLTVGITGRVIYG